MWRLVPKDSAIVYGVIRDVKTREPVANAYVDVVWTQLIVDDKKQLHQRRLKLDTKANGAGVFGICGVPSRNSRGSERGRRAD